MTVLRNQMIFASAGSGKTYALTTRFIGLLALGAAPERIVALTFTRKAAGEFFGEILRRLAGAGADEAKARTLAAEVGRPEWAAADFRRLLRGMIGAMHRLNLGTLDGFFARIVRAFPLELGLGGEPGILDEHAAAEEKRRVFAKLFATRGELAPEQRALIEAFRLATFGSEGKSVAASLDRFVDEHLALYREVPVLSRWGERARIWPRGFPWAVPADDAAVARAAAEIVGWAEQSSELKDKPRERWLAFAHEAADWMPGQPLAANHEFVLKKALAEWAAVEAGGAQLTIDRQKLDLGPEVCGPLAVLVRRTVGLELARRILVTQGVAKVMQAFDRLYDEQVRRAGRLTFADLQQLLAEERAAEGGGAFAAEGLDYRLDGRLDHWLFDEFQDTSHQQWKILETLVDEVVQDAEGRRSLFYVGDVKQAIFTWRGGDPRLFTHVAARYRDAAGGGIEAGELNESWRSGPALIEMVNRVCGDGAVLAELFPEAAPEWAKYWRAHRTVWPDRRGQAALLLADDAEGRRETTLRLLQELRPTERGLSCAVLVQSNAEGARLADHLRREGGIAAVAESDLKIGEDNPVATALAALLQLAAHPGDGFARQQVALSPLAGLLGGRGLADPAWLGRRVLGAIERDGFEPWLADWARRLEPVLAADDAFSRLRLRQLVAAGRAFDALGQREVDVFLRYLGEYTVREPEGAGVVRVMTIHKSKGLGFDVVVLPDLQGNKLAQRRDGPAVRKTADRAVDWVLQHPGALIAESDPVLREYQKEAIAENCYEQLSLLYVALTRAKLAQYVVIEPVGKSKSLNFPKLLAETLGEDEVEVRVGGAMFRGAWSAGEADWMGKPETGDWRPETGNWRPETGNRRSESGERNAETGSSELGLGAEACVAAAVRRAALVARRPSAAGVDRVRGAQLFAEANQAGLQFGTQVHALFAAVEWWEGAEALGVVVAGTAREVGASEAAMAEALDCAGAEALAGVFRRAGRGDEVWRERAFEVVVDGAWVSGVIDRVVVRRDAAGEVVAAEVYDFKTERGVGDEVLAERHAAQLGLYRSVVARLTGLAGGAVRAFIVATAKRTLVEVG